MLKDKGEEIYNELKGYLEKYSTFDMVDEYNITELAFYFQVFYEAGEKISNQDLVMVYPNKQTGVNPYFKALIDASKQIRGIAQKIGIYDIIKSKLSSYGKIVNDTEEYMK